MLCFIISNKRERRQIEHASGPIEFGRGPQRNNVARCVIADPAVGNDHVRIEELPGGKVRVENLSPRGPIRLADNTTLPGGASQEMDLPVLLTIGETLLDIEPGPEEAETGTLESLDEPAATPTGKTPSLLELCSAPAPETLVRWFETAIAVQQAAANSPEFYEQTARALVDLIGLDRGLVLLRRGDGWEVATRCGRPAESGSEFSQTVLRRVVEERRTFYQTAAAPLPTQSLAEVEAVVAAPVLGADSRVVGVLYGSRVRLPGSRGGGIGPLESRLVQLLASAIGAGLARLEQEAEAARLRVQFEQFFSADLARQLQHNPALLEGQEREVTVLFSDIRGFSRLAERLPCRDTCRLVADVMERLSARIREHEGVVVDYLGDGLLAMWNAPADIPRHAELACRAALAMQAEVPALSDSWQAVLGSPLRLGIGMNTGPALVGNTGSRQKFKYGPLGHTVNLASRVEGATKQFGVPVLITGSTRAQLGEAFATRRLCRVRVVGIAGAVDLYELHAEPAGADWLARRDAYEQALALYESGRWAAACQAVYALLSRQEEHYDTASLGLGLRAAACLNTPPAVFDPVLELSSK